jgi:hypothetical protein
MILKQLRCVDSYAIEGGRVCRGLIFAYDKSLGIFCGF